MSDALRGLGLALWLRQNKVSGGGIPILSFSPCGIVARAGAPEWPKTTAESRATSAS